MKKILSLILVLMMVVPFGVLASADETDAVNEIPTKIDLPEMPAVSADNVQYLAFGNTASDTTPKGAKVINTQGWDPVNHPTANPEMANALKPGGTFIACGKIYIASTCTVAATDSPILFTGVDAKNNIDFTSRNPDGTPLVKNEEEQNAGQLGMFMIREEHTATFNGDVIFDNICLLDRGGMEKYIPSTYAVGPTGKMVITNTVEFVKMKAFFPALQVQEGGYLFLDALGFENISGSGVIVVGDSIKDQINEKTFGSFKGIVCSTDGTVLYYLKKAPTGQNPAPKPGTEENQKPNATPGTGDEGKNNTTPGTGAANNNNTNTNTNNNKAPVTNNAPAPTDNNDGGNGAIVWIIVAVAVVAVAGVVVVIVIKKKKAE